MSHLLPLTTLLASERQRHRFSEYAANGGAFAYPTATVYGLGSTVHKDAVLALAALKGRPTDKRFLVVSGHADSFEGLSWSSAARTLAKRFWPGRMTLILEDPDGVFPAALHGPQGGVAVRHSAHPGVRAVEWAVGSPLTSTSANPPGFPPALDAHAAQAVLETLGAEQPWTVDGGRLRASPSSTIVDCTADPPFVVREGTIHSSDVESALNGEQADPAIDPPRPFSILFVCTGNTCRSPLAEAIAKARFAELSWAGSASSAGVFGAVGSPASPDSVSVARAHGLDLEHHVARQLNPDLIDDADLILTMGPGHLEQVMAMGGGGKASLLTAFAAGAEDPFDGAGVIDPIGAGLAVYEATYETLRELIQATTERLAPLLAPSRGARG